MIPHKIEIYEDEYWYGWILRLSYSNALFPDIIYHEYLTGRQPYGKRQKRINLNYPKGICRSPDALIGVDDIPDFINKHTIYGVMNMMRNRSKGDALVHNMLWDAGDDLSIPLRYNDVQFLYFCPDCYREDVNSGLQPYYRTWHHIPGCTVCPRHGVPLYQVRHTANNNERLDDDSISRVTSGLKKIIIDERDIVASKYLYTLYQQPTYTSIKDMSSVLGYAFRPEPRYDRVLSKMIQFTSADMLVQELKSRESDVISNIQSLVPDTFDVISNVGNATKVRCRVCGAVYYDSPTALLKGCVSCDERVEHSEIIARQLRLVGDGEYYLAEPFHGYNGTTKVLHKTCGTISNVRLLDRIWKGTECRCINRTSVREIQSDIDPLLKQYTILSYTGGRNNKQRVRVLHHKCGKDFDVLLDKFKKSPYCRCCTPYAWDTEVFQNQLNLRKEGYEVVSDYISQNVPIKARHAICGTVTEWLPEQWLHGHGCKLCQPIYKYEMVSSYVKRFTNEPVLTVEKEKGGMRLNFGGPETIWKTYQEIMQELTRPSDSELFTKRTERLHVEVSDKAQIYLAIKEAKKDKGYWKMVDCPENISYGRMKQIVRLLQKWGYIEKIKPGCYVIAEDNK